MRKDERKSRYWSHRALQEFEGERGGGEIEQNVGVEVPSVLLLIKGIDFSVIKGQWKGSS